MAGEAMVCLVCHGQDFREAKILWPALIMEWELSPAEVRLIDRQQGLCCWSCGSNLRSMTIAAAFLKEFESTDCFETFVETSETARSSRLLEINNAGTLSRWLSRFRHYTIVKWPDVDMQDLKIEDRSYDIVVHSDTLEHVPDPVRALRECRRILSPRGRLCFTIPIVPTRLTRRRTELPPSYHGAPGQRAGDFRVVTEYGADFFMEIVAAGFTSVTLHTLGDPSSFCLVCR